jgi:hypothetical protein
MTDTSAFASLLKDLASLKPPAQRPNRYQAREALLHLGQAIEAGEDVTDRLTALGKAIAAMREAWEAALTEEIQLAGAEHVRGVDPRHLDHPGYDLNYTLSARQRLGWRFRALEAMDVAVPDDLRDRVARADALLEAKKGPFPENQGDPARGSAP